MIDKSTVDLQLLFPTGPGYAVELGKRISDGCTVIGSNLQGFRSIHLLLGDQGNGFT